MITKEQAEEIATLHRQIENLENRIRDISAQGREEKQTAGFALDWIAQKGGAEWSLKS